MKKAAFLFFRVEVGNAACAVQYLVVVQTMLVRCPKNLDFTVFQKVSLSNLIFWQSGHDFVSSVRRVPVCAGYAVKQTMIQVEWSDYSSIMPDMMQPPVAPADCSSCH